MVEKVLGILKKDVDVWHKDNSIHTFKNKKPICVTTVPVVSVEWLEKWCKKRMKDAVANHGPYENAEYDSGVENGIKEACNDLLSVVRKQTKTKEAGKL